MAERNYPIPANPVYDPEIRALQDSDPASASSVFNPLFERLITNIHALKLLADGKAELSEDGKVQLEQLPMAGVLSDTSNNPVSSAVVYAALSEINTAIENVNNAITIINNALGGKAASNHSHNAATAQAAGFMAAADKAKLDGIAAGANKTVVDAAISNTSTNPVQNKIVYAELAKKAANTHTHNYAASASAGGAANTAVKLATARTLRTKLNSTGAASFDGSANVTPGVEGTLPVANGGSGATTLTSGAALIGNGTAAIQARAITNNTATSGGIAGSTNLLTMNTLKNALNRTTSVAAADTAYTTYMARGIAASTATPSSLVNGCIHIKY